MKKSYIVILIIILIVIGTPCLINMSNFGMGSNMMFYRTVSDYPDTVWICKKPEAIITVTEQKDEKSGYLFIDAILSIETNGKEDRFRIGTLADKLELCRLDSNGEEIDPAGYEGNKNRILTRVKYRKNIFGEITSFRIKVREGSPSINGYTTLKFVKQK